MSSIGFTRLASVTASTKRLPVEDGDGLIGAPSENVASLACTPLDPVDPELRARLALDTPHELLQTFTEETDILEGDILVVAAVEYPIKSVAEWADFRGATYVHIILEHLKAS